jgi:hypothetical protein
MNCFHFVWIFNGKSINIPIIAQLKCIKMINPVKLFLPYVKDALIVNKVLRFPTFLSKMSVMCHLSAFICTHHISFHNSQIKMPDFEGNM